MDFHKIEGHGDTTKKADKDLSKKRNGLVKKLDSKNISTKLNVKKTIYQGFYEPKKEGNPKLGFESKEGWDDITKRASEYPLDNYKNPQFTVEKYIALTKKQKQTINNGPTAGPRERNTSGIERYLPIF